MNQTTPTSQPNHENAHTALLKVVMVVAGRLKETTTPYSMLKNNPKLLSRIQNQPSLHNYCLTSLKSVPFLSLQFIGWTEETWSVMDIHAVTLDSLKINELVVMHLSFLFNFNFLILRFLLSGRMNMWMDGVEGETTQET